MYRAHDSSCIAFAAELEARAAAHAGLLAPKVDLAMARTLAVVQIDQQTSLVVLTVVVEPCWPGGWVDRHTGVSSAADKKACLKLEEVVVLEKSLEVEHSRSDRLAYRHTG